MSVNNKTDPVNTPDEIVDLVDENDNVIGNAPKWEVNSNPKLIHREIGIIIVNENKEILIQQRSRFKETYPLVWIVSVAGHVPSGMTADAAAHKELKEELGFDVPLTYVTKHLWRWPNESHIAFLYIGFVNKNIKALIDENEIEQIKFVNNDDINKMILEGEEFESTSLEAIRNFWKGIYNTQ